MRCKACNKEGAVAYDPPDYYCEECLEVIFKTTGKDYTLGDVMDNVLGKDNVKEVLKNG